MNTQNEKNYEKMLAQLITQNRALQNSAEFRWGKRLLLFKNLLLKGKFNQLYKRIHNTRRNQQFHKTCLDKQPSVKAPASFENLPIQSSGPSTTIYTCIVGPYDMPKTPLLHYSNCKYILFTDQINVEAPGWEVRPLPAQVLAQANPTAKNRYLKFHPHEFFDTDYSIYIDGNVRPLTSWEGMLPPAGSKTGLAMFTHPYRDCIYTEAKACLALGKGNPEKLKAQIVRYQQEKFPAHYGLNEATLIVADLRNSKSKEILTAWWNEFLNSASNRDQIALPYVLWKMGLKPADIENLGEDIQQDSRLQVYIHDTVAKKN